MKQLPRAKIYTQLGIIGLLLLSACAPTPTLLATATQAPEKELIPTQIESPALTAEPTELVGPSFTNPVYKHDFPDPHVIRVDDTYYAYSTNTGGTNIPVLTSTDLVNWDSRGDALPALPKWAMLNFGNVWAPGVIQVEDQFVMY